MCYKFIPRSRLPDVWILTLLKSQRNSLRLSTNVFHFALFSLKWNRPFQRLRLEKVRNFFFSVFLTGPHRNSNFRAGEKPKNVNIHFRIHFVVNSDRFLNFISLLKNIIFTYLFQAITSNCVVPPEDIVIVVYFSFSQVLFVKLSFLGTFW